MKNPSIVTASELSEYVYCPRAWWLAQQGKRQLSWAMQEGSDRHDELSGRLGIFGMIQRIVYGGIAAGVVLLLVGLAWLLFGT